MRSLEPQIFRLFLVMALLSARLGGPGRAEAAEARYRVTLTTLSAGEEVFERFGHTVLSIEDRSGPSAWVYSFGTFDSDAPHLWHKALHKRLRYWVVAMSPLLMTLRYDHRAGVVQELDLDAQQAGSLSAQLAWIVRPENREYPYDLFTDNCVTRLRDLLDAACGGALRRQTAGPAPLTFRQAVMKTLAPVPLLAAAATLIYGPYTDKPRSRWESLFLPDALRDALTELDIAEGGPPHPLLRKQWNWQGEYYSPPRRLPHPLWGPVVMGLLLLYGAACCARGKWERGCQVLGGVGASLSLLMAALGLILCYLRTTPHLCFQHNNNSLLISPLTGLAAPLFILLSLGRHSSKQRRLLILAVTLPALLLVWHGAAGHLFGACGQMHGGVWLSAAAAHATLLVIAVFLRAGSPASESPL